MASARFQNRPVKILAFERKWGTDAPSHDGEKAFISRDNRSNLPLYFMYPRQDFRLGGGATGGGGGGSKLQPFCFPASSRQHAETTATESRWPRTTVPPPQPPRGWTTAGAGRGRRPERCPGFCRGRAAERHRPDPGRRRAAGHPVDHDAAGLRLLHGAGILAGARGDQGGPAPVAGLARPSRGGADDRGRGGAVSSAVSGFAAERIGDRAPAIGEDIQSLWQSRPVQQLMHMPGSLAPDGGERFHRGERGPGDRGDANRRERSRPRTADAEATGGGIAVA